MLDPPLKFCGCARPGINPQSCAEASTPQKNEGQDNVLILGGVPLHVAAKLVWPSVATAARVHSGGHGPIKKSARIRRGPHSRCFLRQRISLLGTSALAPRRESS